MNLISPSPPPSPNNYLNVFPKKKSNKTKIIVFDIDETIGSFNEIYVLWKCLKNINSNLNQNFFNCCLDLYPEFFRHGIITILEYIQYKKRINCCHGVYLYTNNMYSPDLPNKIKNYIHYRLEDNFFIDKLIYAYKINDVIINQDRTTNRKTYEDFLRCSKLSKTTDICFVDDIFHSGMKNDNVYYIQPKPYFHHLTYNQILTRFFVSSLFRDFFELHHQQYIKNYYVHHYEEFDLNKLIFNIHNDVHIQKNVSKKIMSHIKFFFFENKRNKTRKLSNVFT